MIKEAIIAGKEVRVRYSSEVWKCYMRKEDIPQNLGGVHPIPKTVKEFLRSHTGRIDGTLIRFTA